MHRASLLPSKYAWAIFLLFINLVCPIFAQTSKPADTESKPGTTSSPLSAEDIIEINVYQEEDLQTKARISPTGTITFPLIGEVKVSGISPEAAAQVIRSELAKDYLVNPQVTVTVLEYAKRRFTVLGQVQKPGAYEMPDRDVVSLLQAIGAAGGYTRIADAGDIRVKRTVDGKDTIFKLNAKNIASGKDPNSFIVESGDIITVGESVF